MPNLDGSFRFEMSDARGSKCEGAGFPCLAPAKLHVVIDASDGDDGETLSRDLCGLHALGMTVQLVALLTESDAD